MPKRRLPPTVPLARAKVQRPKHFTAAEWEAVLVAGDRALFAFRIVQARRAANMDQEHFGAQVGVAQQTISEWERGDRALLTLDMIHLGAKLTGRHAHIMFTRPDTAHTDDGVVFWTAVAAELSAVTRGTPRVSVKTILAAFARTAERPER